MTLSQWLDILVVAIGFVAAVSGWRSGALGSSMSFVGVALGAVAGVLLAPHVLSHIDGPRTKLFATLFLILALVVIGEIAGVVVGRAVRRAIRHGGARIVDSATGVLLQLTVVLVLTFLLGTVLVSSRQPNLVSAVNGSRSFSALDEIAPGWLRAVPQRLAVLRDNSGLPAVLQQLRLGQTVDVDPPDVTLASSPVIAVVQPSVVKVRGIAPGCQKVLEGSGFVVAPNRVMSNAHVVAGSEGVTVESDGNVYDATVVAYDPDEDISILQAPDLPAKPLQFAENHAVTGTDALVVGYPGGGDFAATPVRVRETIELNSPDIYRKTTVVREVYTVRGVVRQGNSGGPLVNRPGQVLGVVFGAAVDDDDTGFALTASEVSRQMARVGNSEPVPTGSCVP